MNEIRHRVAYVSRGVYPSFEASALQASQMAAAFARQTRDTHLFVHALFSPEDQVRQQFNMPESSLHIWSLHAGRWPSPLYNNGQLRSLAYNSAVAALLKTHPRWWRGADVSRIVFVRSRLESLYWGHLRRFVPGFKKWTFVFEAHDIAGLEYDLVTDVHPLEIEDARIRERNRRTLRALSGFDLILCVTQALADDLARWSDGRLQPHVVRHASAQPRLPHPPALPQFGDRVVLGYVGMLDVARGVETLVRAMALLPERYHLRLVGSISADAQPYVDALLGEPGMRDRVDLVGQVPVADVASEIDRCDIMVQPASDNIISLRYRAPLKSFDYMVRGKPVVAADVSCHRELYQDGVNAVLYRNQDAEHLVECVTSLVAQPRKAEALARAAWEQAAEYAYDARAQRILSLVDERKRIK